MSSTGPRFRTPADVRAIPDEQIDEWVRAGTLPIGEFGPECDLVLGAVVRAARRRMGRPPGARRLDVRATRAAFAAGALGLEPDAPETVAADPSIVDTESDPAYGHVVRHGTRTSYEYPNRRADALRASATAEAGYTRDARSQPCSGAHRRESGAGATTAAPEQRPAVTREAAGGIPGSAPAGWTERERLAFLRRVQHVDPRERRA